MPNQATRIELARHGAVLVVRVSGFYARLTAFEVRDRANAAIEDRHALKVILDLRGSVCLMSPDEWAALAKDLVSDPIRADVGMLVSESEISHAWRRCVTLAGSGRTRLPFESAEQAAMWAGVAVTALRPARPFVPVF